MSRDVPKPPAVDFFKNQNLVSMGLWNKSLADTESQCISNVDEYFVTTLLIALECHAKNYC